MDIMRRRKRAVLTRQRIDEPEPLPDFYAGMEMNSPYYSSFAEFEREAQRIDNIIEKYGREAAIALLIAYLSDEDILRRILRSVFGTSSRKIPPPIDPSDRLNFFKQIEESLGVSAVYRRETGKVLRNGQEAAREMLQLMNGRYGTRVSEQLIERQTFEYFQTRFRNYNEGVVRTIERAFNILEDRGVFDVQELSEGLLQRYTNNQHTAMTVARTAIGEVSGLTQMRVFSSDPNISYVRWVTRYDNRVRPQHRRNGNENGGLIEPGQRWPDGSFHCPSGYNCRCRAEGVVEEAVERGADGELRIISAEHIGEPALTYPDE